MFRFGYELTDCHDILTNCMDYCNIYDKISTYCNKVRFYSRDIEEEFFRRKDIFLWFTIVIEITIILILFTSI